MALEYRDAYLAPYCTYEVEQAAYTAVDLDGTFEAEWRNPLTVLKAYTIACLENQADAEDLFEVKYKAYKAEYDELLARARTASVDSEGNLSPVFSIPVERA